MSDDETGEPKRSPSEIAEAFQKLLAWHQSIAGSVDPAEDHEELLLESLADACDVLGFVCEKWERAQKECAMFWRARGSAVRRRGQGRVYFIRARPDGLIKIGYSTYVKGRLAALQTSSGVELHLLASTPGTPKDETALHRRFEAARERGEWFRPVPELLTHIAALRRQTGGRS